MMVRDGVGKMSRKLFHRDPGHVRGRQSEDILTTGDMAQVTLGWADEAVPLHTHACFYYTDEPTLKQTLTFVRIGLDEPGTFNVIFADEKWHRELLGWLDEGYQGDLDQALEQRRLAVIGGAATRERLLMSIAAELDAAIERGAKLIRFLGFIAWGAGGWPDEDELLEFESQVNQAVMAYPAVIICTYGVPRLTGRQLIEGGLGTHPVVFLNDRTLHGSPLYIKRGA